VVQTSAEPVEPAPVDEPAVEVKAEPAVEAPEIVKEVVEAASPVEAPEEVKEEVVAPPVEEEAKPETAEPVEASPAEKPEAAAPVEAASTEKPAPKPKSVVGNTPRYVGLGAAVIKPPPGYDPTNPNTWRRPATPAAKPNDASSRRRRVASPERGGGRGGGRVGRRRGIVQNRMNRNMRRRTGGPKGGGTVAMKAEKRKVRVDNMISVGQLAHEMQIKATVIIRQLMEMGSMVTVNEMLDIDTATLVAAEFEYEVENVGFQEESILQHVQEEEDDSGIPRAAVVTIMGHVDHGKTTLLDAIRQAKVAAGEAGGITQHIGAYQVECNGQLITFLDTPGHAAFTAMRARGAEVTDLVILVVAGDDGVKDQTIEALNHAKAANVPIIVAVNKMDKAGASMETAMTQLSDHGLAPEAWGGDTQYVPVSALKKEGIDDLLEGIILQTEILELTANPDRPAEGVVIEAKMERGKGTVASVLVQRGTLKKGDNIVLGTAFGRVRAMVDFNNKPIKIAPPSTPVELFGISGLPEVGDTVSVVASEKDARTVAEHREKSKREDQFRNTQRRTAEDLFRAAAQDKVAVCHVVLKADVQGSVGALRYALENLTVAGAELRILHTGIGNINESDVILAAANQGLLLGFNVKIDGKARRVAESQGAKAELYKVIYDLIDRVEREMTGMLEPEFEEVHRGTVEVRNIFKISRIGTVAGCYVQSGRVRRSDKVRVMRGDEELWNGPIGTLKRFKDDVKEVNAGYECGIALDGFNDIAEDDRLEVYAIEEITTK
jgi:translation initiation factor IF-2